MKTLVLDSETITTAQTGVAKTAQDVSGADVSSLVLLADFTYGSGGTDAKVWVQTTIDGSNWLDIACFYFTTASAKAVAVLSARTPVTTVYTPTDGTLGNNTVKDGILGNQFRVKLTTTGTYATNTTLVVTAGVKN